MSWEYNLYINTLSWLQRYRVGRGKPLHGVSLLALRLVFLTVRTESVNQTSTIDLGCIEYLVDIRPYYHKRTIEEIRNLAVYEILNRPGFGELGSLKK